MTVPSSVSKAGPYTADGSVTEFTFPFPILEASHLNVWLNNTIITDGYTVTVAPDGAGGTVVFSEPPEEGSTVTILRSIPVTQLLDVQNNTAFLPEILETAYDKLTMICQMLLENVGRCVQVNPASGVAPSLTGYAGDFAVTHLGGSDYRVEPGRIIVDGEVETETTAVTLSVAKGSIYLTYIPDTKIWEIGVSASNGTPYQLAVILGDGLVSQVQHGSVYYFTGSGGGDVEVDGTLSAAITAENGTLKAVESATGVLYMQNGVLTLRGTATCPVAAAAEES